MKIAICDDNIGDSLALKNILLHCAKTREFVIEEFNTSATLFSEIQCGKQYDVAFLDIDMPEVTGLELGSFIKSKSPNTFIVFVTSYPQYAINAFDCEAFHYLLKPIEVEKLQNVVNKIMLKYNERNRYHMIKTKTAQLLISIKDIYFVECCRKHILYHMKDETHETVDTLTQVYGALKDYGFFQVHQGFVVNLDKISCFEKDRIVLEDGKRVLLSKRRRNETILAYSKYLQEHV